MSEKKHDETLLEEAGRNTPDSAEKGAAAHQTRPGKRGPVRKLIRWTAFGMAGLLGLVTVSAGGGLLFLRSDMGERWLTDTVNSALASLPSGLSGKVEAFKGPLLSEAHLEGLVLRDKRGEWLTAKSANLRIDWFSLPKSFVIKEVSLNSPVLLRTPELEASAAPEPEVQAAPATPEEMLASFDDFLKNWPEYLPELCVEELALRSANVTKGASPLPFTATVLSSATAGKSGVQATLSATREDGPLPADAPNRRASVDAALVPGLKFKLDAKLSDLGFLKDMVPEKLGASPAFALAVNGNAPVDSWKASLSGTLSDEALRAKDSAHVITTLMGKIGLRPLDEAPQVKASLDVESGAQAKRLWAMAGQKDGRFAVKIDADAKSGKQTDAKAALEIRLADMQWSSSLLDALLGKELTAGTSASVLMTAAGSLQGELQKLYAQAAHIKADASGTVAFDGKGLYSPASRVDLKAGVALNDAATLSPELSGDMQAQAALSGTLTALKTELGLTGSRLDTASLKLKDVDLSLDIPSADVARIVDALSGVTRAKASGPLMEGALKASAAVNEQPAGLAANWRVKEAGKSGLGVALESLDMKLGANRVAGQLAARMDGSAPVPAKGTVSAMLGTALPALDGLLNIEVADWEALKKLSGLAMSGKPMKAELSLENKGRQALSFSASLSEFQMHADGQNVALSDFRFHADGSDLWGKPFVSLTAGLKELKAGKAAVKDTALEAEGGLDAFSFALQSAGGVESRVKGEWKPGALFVEELKAKVVPAELGLAKGEAVGMELKEPLKLSYHGDSVELPSLSAELLPAGSLDVQGKFSPGSMKGSLNLAGVNLAPLRKFSQALPPAFVDMTADFSGAPHAPLGNLKLNLKEVLVPGLDSFDVEVTGALGMKGRKRMLEAKVDLPEKTLKALSLKDFAATASVPFTSPSSGVSLPDMKAPFSADLVLNGQVAGLWKLVPAADLRLSGLMELDARVRGKLAAPVVTAHLSLDKGRFFDIMNGIGLHHIGLKVDAEQFDIMNKKAADKVTFAMNGRAGSKGTLELGGWLEPSDMSLDISGTMKDLAPLRRQDAKVMLSGTLGVTGTAASPLVKADITVDRGQVELAKLPGSSIPELEIWTPEAQKAKEEAPAVPGHLDVRVRIPNQFFVRGYGLDCEWGGELVIDAPINRPAVKGQLQAVRGTLDIFGKNFKLARGEVRFDGGWPVSPLIDIDMQYTASNITADILVGGMASNPKLTLVSQPSYPQDEIISQIMFGQSSSSLSHAQAIQLASGAASLAGFGGADIMSTARKMLGVDVFRVNSDNDGEDSDVSNTSLEVGTYVHDKVYVGMEQGVGKQADSAAVVEVELLPSLGAQIKAGSKDSEMGLEWKKNY